MHRFRLLLYVLLYRLSLERCNVWTRAPRLYDNVLITELERTGQRQMFGDIEIILMKTVLRLTYEDFHASNVSKTAESGIKSGRADNEK